MNKNILIGLVVALLALGGWYYYSQSQSSQNQGNTNTAQTDTTPTNGTQPTGTMETGTVDANAGTSVTVGVEKDFTVNGFNYGFSPTTLTVKKGDHVKITFTNSGGMHDFVIDEFNVRSPRIETGDSATVEFDATKAGTFQYYCSVANHRAMGMWGTLTVTK